MKQITIKSIGVIHSCFTEKFGIPRQPGMVPASTARLELFEPFAREEMVRELAQFSHIWVHFIFHETVKKGWKPTVRPPWLGGQKRVGVFATRSPHRPNHLGLSVVRLEGLSAEKGAVCLELSGVDILDGTPVVDIKPYLPYSDSIRTASCGFSTGTAPDVEVTFSGEAQQFCRWYQLHRRQSLEQLIRQTLGQDPRPASQKGSKEEFGVRLWDVNVRWRAVNETFHVLSCALLPPDNG